ncbi:MAG: EamA family transporter [Arachnia sp.]
MEAKRDVGWSVAPIGAVAPIVWGTTYIVTTELLPAGHPMTAAVLRAVPAGLLLLLITRQWPRVWGRLVILAALNIGAFFPLLFVAAYRLPGGLAAVVGAGQPLVVALFALIVGLGATPGRQLGWAVAAVTGVAIAMATGTAELDAVGVVAACAGTASMGLGVTLTRAWGAPGGLSGLAATGWQLVLGGVMILPLVPLVDRGPFVIDGAAAVGYVWLSLVGGAVAYGLWFHAARRLPATSTALLGPLSPVTAAVLGWAVLGQSLALPQMAGFGVALVSSILGQRPPKASGPRVRRVTAAPVQMTPGIRWYAGG